MKNWGLYRLLLDLIPADGTVRFSTFSKKQTRAIQYTLRRHRCKGASLCVFDPSGVRDSLAFGDARRGVPAGMDTVYRAASISKFVTALGAMKLKEQGIIDLDRDVNDVLPFPLRHPAAPDTPITLRMLMSHTAGICDSENYNAGIAQGVPLRELLRDRRVFDAPPGRWLYSNLGAGIAGVVMEAAAGADFETLMQETVFGPLGVEATYYPQKARGLLADAWRVLPPRKSPPFDGAARQSRPLPPKEVNADRHYALAHGNLCVSAPALAQLGIAGMAPGFLQKESLDEMRRIVVPFGDRGPNLSQGLFTFILNEPGVCPRPLFGHQGMAYGAVHGLFFDPEKRRGAVLLTSGASEARRGVMADLNIDLFRLLLGEHHGSN